jgi:protocatechuate 3,4-dioxygenase beta subunit
MIRPFVSAALAASLTVASLASAQTISSGSSSTIDPSPGTGAAQRPGAPPRDAGPMRRTGTARLRGRVTSDTGIPLRRAQVIAISPATGGPQSATTDAEGRYDFRNLPAGTYSVSASKGGFIAAQFGQRRPPEPGTPVTLAEGQVREQIDLVMRRGGVIAGHITDELGEPIVGAQVQVQRYQYGPNGRQLTFAQTGPGAFITDDLGQFRVFGLTPGDYVVSARVQNGIGIAGSIGADDTSEGYPPTFHPGTVNPAEAETVRVDVGQEASVHFGLIPARLGRISGRVLDSQGRPAAGAALSVGSASGGGMVTMGGGQVAPDGTFTLARIPPGDHFIRVAPRPNRIEANSAGGVVGGVVFGNTAEDAESAIVPVTIAGDDITGLVITTGRAATITGRVVFEGSTPRPANAQFMVFAQSVGSPSGIPQGMLFAPAGGRRNGEVGADGTFELRGAGGKILFRPNTPPAWTLKSVTLKGVDITDVPYELSGSDDIDGVRIVLTDKVTNVSGTVSDGRGQPPDGFAVLVWPADDIDGPAAQRFVRGVRLSKADRFDIRGLPPGSYVAAALEWLPQGGEWDPEIRDRLRAAGERFSLTEGQSVSLNLKLRDEP